MRVAQVITVGHEVYGAQKHVLDLATRLASDGHEVLVVVGSTGPLTDRLAARGIAWSQVPSLRRPLRPLDDLRALRGIRDVLADFGPDVVGSHSSKAGFLTRLACYWLEIPNVFTAHGWSFEDGVPPLRRALFRWLERAVGLVSDAVITVAPRGRDLALRHGVIRSDRLRLIPYGSPDVGANRTRQPQDVFTMTMVAGFRPQKDHATLLRALEGLRERPWQLWLLGDGPLLEESRALAASCRIADRVRFEGMVDDVADYLDRTDLLVLTTHWEGLPISIIEGLSFGLPVLASDVSGVRQQVLDDHNGLVVPPKDVAATRAAIARLLDDPELVRRYAANSRPLFLERFTEDRAYAATLALYEERIAARAAEC